MVLASSAFSDEVFGVLIHSWLEETALPDFGMSTVHTIVSPIWCRMTFLNDSHSFGCGNMLVFLNIHRVIRKRTEDTVVALHPESIQGIEISQGTDV